MTEPLSKNEKYDFEMSSIELLERELDRRNYACAEALEEIWVAICENKYGKWDYPAQAARLILQEWKAENDGSRET